LNLNFNPDGPLDVAVYLIVALPAIIAAAAAFYNQKKELKSQRSIQERTLHEVKNEHSSNLRDDIDGLANAIREGFSQASKDIYGLREELRTERIERIEGDRRGGK
jgi:hypothetical protein